MPYTEDQRSIVHRVGKVLATAVKLGDSTGFELTLPDTPPTDWNALRIQCDAWESQIRRAINEQEAAEALAAAIAELGQNHAIAAASRADAPSDDHIKGVRDALADLNPLIQRNQRWQAFSGIAGHIANVLSG